MVEAVRLSLNVGSFWRRKHSKKSQFKNEEMSPGNQQLGRMASGGFFQKIERSQTHSFGRAESGLTQVFEKNDQKQIPSGGFIFKRENEFGSSGCLEFPIEEENNIIDSIMMTYAQEIEEESDGSPVSIKEPWMSPAANRKTTKKNFTLCSIFVLKNKKNTRSSLSVGGKPKNKEKIHAKDKEKEEIVSMEARPDSSFEKRTERTLKSQRSERVSVNNNYLADAQSSDSIDLEEFEESSRSEGFSLEDNIEDELEETSFKEGNSQGVFGSGSCLKSGYGDLRSQRASFSVLSNRIQVISMLIDHYSNILAYNGMLVSDRTDGLVSTSSLFQAPL